MIRRNITFARPAVWWHDVLVGSAVALTPGRGTPYPARQDDVVLGGRAVEKYFQLVGSLLVLVSFVLLQRGRLVSTSWRYNLFNLAGSALLAATAASGQQWGFLLLEGVWALVSAIALARTCYALRRTRADEDAGRRRHREIGTG